MDFDNFNILEEVQSLLKPGCIYDDEILAAMERLKELALKCADCSQAHKCRPRLSIKVYVILQLWNTVAEQISEGMGGLMMFFVPPLPEAWTGENPCPKEKPKE